MNGPEAAIAACRFLHDAALMLLWGSTAYIVMLVPAGLAGIIAGRLGPWAIVAAAASVVTTFAILPLYAADVGDGWGDAFDPVTLGTLLSDTSLGTAWMIEAGLALLLAATIFVPRGGRRAKAVAVASGLCLASLALTGHAVVEPGWTGIAHRLNDALHVLSAGAWFGAFVPLFAVLMALRTEALRRDASRALWSFSAAGQIAVVFVVATGIANTALVLRRWPIDWSSPYQALLAAKIALVVAMIGIASVNRFVFVPAIPKKPIAAVNAIRRGTLIELALGIAVIALVSIFGILSPE